MNPAAIFSIIFLCFLVAGIRAQDITPIPPSDFEDIPITVDKTEEATLIIRDTTEEPTTASKIEEDEESFPNSTIKEEEESFPKLTIEEEEESFPNSTIEEEEESFPNSTTEKEEESFPNSTIEEELIPSITTEREENEPIQSLTTENLEEEPILISTAEKEEELIPSSKIEEENHTKPAEKCYWKNQRETCKGKDCLQTESCYRCCYNDKNCAGECKKLHRGNCVWRDYEVEKREQ